MANDLWATPPDFFAQLNSYFHFTLDAAASPNNAKCERYFTEADNAFLQGWPESDMIWLNPPYSNLTDWVNLFLNQTTQGVALVRSDTSTAWFKRAMKECYSVHFLTGRLKFEHPTAKNTQTDLAGSVLLYVNKMRKDKQIISCGSVADWLEALNS